MASSSHFLQLPLLLPREKINTKPINEKYTALKEVEEGLSKSQVAIKYGIPKNTLSIWIKSKDTILEAVKTQGNNSKRDLEGSEIYKFGYVIFKWLLAVRNINGAVSASILKTKAKELGEKMNIKDF